MSTASKKASRHDAHDVKGGGENTGMPVSLPPTKPAPTWPDVISTPRNPRLGSGIGMNQYAGRSSLDPGEMSRSPLATSIKNASERGSDAVLDTIVERGTARQDDSITGQLRDIAPRNVPTHPHMSGAKSGGTVPGGTKGPAIAKGFSAAELASKQHGGK